MAGWLVSPRAAPKTANGQHDMATIQATLNLVRGRGRACRGQADSAAAG